jgi:hypothetical protein
MCLKLKCRPCKLEYSIGVPILYTEDSKSPSYFLLSKRQTSEISIGMLELLAPANDRLLMLTFKNRLKIFKSHTPSTVL